MRSVGEGPPGPRPSLCDRFDEIADGVGWTPTHTDFESGLSRGVDWYTETASSGKTKVTTEARYKAQGQ